jgi:hypothetical protein
MESICLLGECGEFLVSPRLWRRILSVAQHYGWKPAGTLPPHPDWIDARRVTLRDRAFWDGRYYPGISQRITERDAEGLAAALAIALENIPDADAVTAACGCGEDSWKDCETCRSMPIPTLLGELSGPTKVTVRDLIGHCRECAELWVAQY